MIDPSQQTLKDDYLGKLQMAATLVAFDRSLIGAAWIAGAYGFVLLAFGLFFVATGRSGWIAIAVGAFLLGEAIYLAKVRSARAILIAGITLASLALWLLIRFAIGWMHKDPSMGRGVIAVFFLAYGAWNLLNSYRSYKLLLEHSDAEVNARVRDTIESMRTAVASETADVVEWSMRGLSIEDGVWRMKPEGDLMLIAKFKDKTFGYGGAAEHAGWTKRSDIRVLREGEKWIGKKLNAKLVVGLDELKISIEPQMLERLESLLMGLAHGR